MRTVVVGAGIVGVCTAYELARRGQDVVLLDCGPVSGGTTGLGEGNVLCGDKDAGPELELTVAGRAMYDEIEELLGAPAKIRRKGSLLVHPDERTWALEAARVARLRAAGVEVSLLDPDAVRQREPQLTGALHGAAFFPGDLQCDPRAITRELADRAVAHGCDLQTDVEVRGIVTDAAGRVVGVRVDGLLRADRVVLAAGPWSAPLAASCGLPLPLEPRKGQLLRVSLPSADERYLRHKVVDGSYLLSVEAAGPERRLSTVVETTHDGAVVIGSSRERCGFDGAVDRDLAVQMQARAARLVGGLAGLPIEDVWVGFRPWLPDHLPAVGASTRVPGLYVGTGHEGAGVANGPISGRLLAQLICDEPTTVDVAPFSPDRFC